MTLRASDIKFFQSELEASSGGAMSMLEIPRDQLCLIFPDVGRGQARYGAAEYRKVFAVNVHPTDDFFVTRLWLLRQPCAGIEMALGLGDPTDTDGEAVSYSAPMAAKDGIYTGDIAPGQAVPVWVRRVVPADTPEFERGFFQLAFTGRALIGA